MSPATPSAKKSTPVSALPIASRRPISPQCRRSSAERIFAAFGTPSTNSRLTRKLTPASAADWTAPPVAELAPADFEALLQLDPPAEFLLLGTGARLAHPPRALREALEARGIGLEVMDSRAAARAWGLLRGEERWIAAALMPL